MDAATQGLVQQADSLNSIAARFDESSAVEPAVADLDEGDQRQLSGALQEGASRPAGP